MARVDFEPLDYFFRIVQGPFVLDEDSSLRIRNAFFDKGMGFYTKEGNGLRDDIFNARKELFLHKEVSYSFFLLGEYRDRIEESIMATTNFSPVIDYEGYILPLEHFIFRDNKIEIIFGNPIGDKTDVGLKVESASLSSINDVYLFLSQVEIKHTPQDLDKIAVAFGYNGNC